MMEHSYPMTEERMNLIHIMWAHRTLIKLQVYEVSLLHRLVTSKQSYYTYTDRNALDVIRTKYIEYLKS